MGDAASSHTVYLALAAVLGHCTRGVGDALRAGTAPAALLACDTAALRALAAAIGPTARAGGAAVTRLRRAPADGERAAQRLQERLDACAATLLTPDDPAWPPALREIPDPPPWLFCRGDPAVLARPAVAVVGSRRASHGGRHVATQFAARLAGAGYVVVSGLARGIDAAAHRGALDRGTTVAVLGTGIDECYPATNHDLFAEIETKGCVISEFPPGTPPHRGQFPRRNRIIAGLAGATVLVEAALPSGSLHTAAAALEQGRDVCIFPWSVLHGGGAGCLALLRDGATPLTSLDELDDHFPRLTQPEERPGDAALLELLGDGSLAFDALVAVSGMTTPALTAALGRLEIAGQVTRQDGAYARAHCKSCASEGS